MPKFKQYDQKFRKEWLKDELFVKWITAISGDDSKAHCKFCDCDVKAKHQHLKMHAKSKKHAKAMQRAEHKLPISLPGVISNTYPDYKIAKDMKCERINMVHETAESVTNKFEMPNFISADEISADTFDEMDPRSTSVIHTDYRSPLSFGPATQSLSRKGLGPTFKTCHHTECRHEVNQKSEDALDLFGKFIIAQIRRLPEEHSIKLTLDIHGLISQKLSEALSDKDTQRNTDDSPKVITVSIAKQLFPK